MKLYQGATIGLVVMCIACKEKKTSADADTKGSDNKTITTVEQATIVNKDLKKYYDEYGLEGMFVLYDPKERKYTWYNASLSDSAQTPASTFNITSALIALEEKIITAENSVMPWSGRQYRNPIARQNLSLDTAFRYNIDWYFWRLRKKIGAEKMKEWIAKLNYGNRLSPSYIDSFKTGPHGIDSFWVVSGDLRITPSQQLSYIQRFYEEDLPFSSMNIRLMKKLMFEKDSAGIKIYGKRGSYQVRNDQQFIGWFVGYVEKENKVYFFVSFMRTPDLEHKSIIQAQKDIVFKIITNESLFNKQ